MSKSYRKIYARPGESINLGREVENNARQIYFKISDWAKLFGEGSVQLIARRPDEAEPYPVPVTIDGDYAVWTVSNSDTAIPGRGNCELHYYAGDTLEKSDTWVTVIADTLGEASENPPAPYQNYVNQVLEAGVAAEGAADRAEAAAKSVERVDELATRAEKAAYQAEYAAKWAAGGPYLLLNLTKYSISSDGTNAEATTNGINQAIADAVADGYSTIVFPKGEYLIAGDDQINITGRLTVDFNNSVLRKEANANESYVMVNISGDHSVVKNATLYGDRETHDYSSEGTHEGGIGIDITADSRFTVIENVDIFDTTGYGINTSVMHNQIEPIRDRPLEAGCYDTGTGELVESTTHTILGYTLDITDSAIKNDMFILGGNGYCAHGIAEPLTFYMSFYDENETYIGFSRAYRLYDTVDLASLLYWYPTLRYIKFSIENTDTETNVTLELRSSYTSDDITIKNCEIARCRTLGIAITGVKRIEVENVSVHDIGGAAPGYGVDVEDGYQLNQYIVFRSCEFYNNKYGDICIVKARDILVENCRFQGLQRSLSTTDAVPIAIGAGAESITSKFEVRGSIFTGTAVMGKNVVFHNCIFLKCNPMSGNFTECRLYGCTVQFLYGTTFKRCYLNSVKITQRGGNFGCYDSVLENECSFEERSHTDGDSSEWWVMEGCTIKDSTVRPRSLSPYIRIANNKFYRDSANNRCIILSTLQKTYLHITGNTFEQAGRIGILHLTDTYGSEVVLEGNVFKSTGASDISPYQGRAHIVCTGLVTVSNNIFDITYLSAAYGVLHLENCNKSIVANNKFLGGYVLPIKMVTVTATLCDGNDYTGTPVLADTRTGVDIPDACSKSYVDGLIGDVDTVIASINTLVGGA